MVTLLLIYLFVSHQGVEEHKEPIAAIGDHKDAGGLIVANIPVYFSSRYTVEEHKEPIATSAENKDVGGNIVANLPVYFSSRYRGGQRTHSCHCRSQRCRWSHCC